jgi:predicted DNA-binding transcriptional regulator AlpA
MIYRGKLCYPFAALIRRVNKQGYSAMLKDKERRQRRLIRRRQVLELLGIKRTALDAALARGDFPKPVTIFAKGRACAWAEDEVLDYIEHRLATRGE